MATTTGKNGDVLERYLTPEEIEYMSQAISLDRYNNGMLKDIDPETLQKYLSNPSMYKKELQKYAWYQYITDGDIFALFDMVRILPNLNYAIKSLNPCKSDESRILNVRKVLTELNHKELTRDIVSQLVSSGTVCGVILGKTTPKSKDNPYVIIFDDLEYIFPGRRVGGKWTVWIDLNYFTIKGNLDYKMDLLSSLDPFITVEDIQNYLDKGEEYRYIEIPPERSVCIRTHTLRRNQRFGLPWNHSSIFDSKHKQKLKDLEKSVSNKVINSVAVLTIGLDNETSTYKKIGKPLATSIFNNVKRGLTETKDDAAAIISLPEFAKIQWPDLGGDDALDSSNTEAVTSDISMSTGLARGLITGTDTTYAVAKLNLDLFFRRVSEILENIENEVFNKIIKIVLPKSAGNNYLFEYEKQYPISLEDKVQMLKSLSDSGYSVRYLVEALGIDFNEFIKNSLYEIDELKLRDKIKPPLTSFTATGEDLNGEKKDLNENTEKDKNNGGNKSPKPSD